MSIIIFIIIIPGILQLLIRLRDCTSKLIIFHTFRTKERNISWTARRMARLGIHLGPSVSKFLLPFFEYSLFL